MSGTAAAGLERRRAEIVSLCHRQLDSTDLLAAVGACVRCVVPSNAGFWSTIDPATLLFTGGVVDDLPGWACHPYFDNEFLVEDVDKFCQLADADVPVAVLSATTGGKPQVSPRFREICAPLGLDDELRVVFRSGGVTWGIADLFRQGRDFTDGEAHFVVSVADHIGAGLQTAVVAAAARAPSSADSPGVITLDAAGRMEALTAEAARWLPQLFDLEKRERRHGSDDVPNAIYVVAAWARACAMGHDDRPPLARVRLPSGQWLALHGAALWDTAGPTGQTSVVLEPPRSAELGHMIVRAYNLSNRERQVVELVARGRSTDEIAQQLFISAYTVRDHLKAVFEKVGVSSRGALVARVFADHYLERVAGSRHPSSAE